MNPDRPLYLSMVCFLTSKGGKSYIVVANGNEKDYVKIEMQKLSYICSYLFLELTSLDVFEKIF